MIHRTRAECRVLIASPAMRLPHISCIGFTITARTIRVADTGVSDNGVGAKVIIVGFIPRNTSQNPRGTVVNKSGKVTLLAYAIKRVGTTNAVYRVLAIAEAVCGVRPPYGKKPRARFAYQFVHHIR